MPCQDYVTDWNRSFGVYLPNYSSAADLSEALLGVARLDHSSNNLTSVILDMARKVPLKRTKTQVLHSEGKHEQT